MTVRAKLRVAGTGLLSAALMASVTQVLIQAPAHAVEDPIVIQSSPLAVAPAAPPLVVRENVGTGQITVTNPGGTAPTTQKCIEGVTDLSFCLGTSDQLVYPQDTNLGPITVTNAPTSPDLPGTGMDWMIDEARSTVAAIHGVRADDLVGTYARAEIRAVVDSRLREILNKKLYGKPMTDQENSAYAVMAEFYKAKLVSKAKQSLREYDMWSANPCTYPVPAPPSSKFPVVPNPVAGTPTCGAGGGITALFKYTNGTPPVSTFDTWASYRNPTPAMKYASDANYERMLSESMNAAYTLGSIGAGIAVAAAAHVAITTMNLALIAIYTAEHGGPLFLAAGGVATVFAAVAIAIIITGIAIYQIIEDNKPGTEIRQRVTDALANNDPLGIEASKPAYAGLDIDSLEDPSSGPKAAIHEFDFEKSQSAQVNEWLMFDGGGSLVVDPSQGFNVGGDIQPDDLRFYNENEVVKNPLVVLAPAGTKDAQGHNISGYNVRITRGWLMVSTVLQGQATGGPYRPRLSLRYDDGSSFGSANMTLIRNSVPGEPETTRFAISRVHPVSNTLIDEVTDTWTLQTIGDVSTTVHLKQGEPALPAISVVPSVQGNLVADNLTELQANLSGPGLGTGGTFTWTLQRLTDAGGVAETVAVPAGNLTGFQKRIVTPGRYRALVTYAYDNPVPRTASGRVDFTVEAPAPEVLQASVKDDRVLDGSLSLDLRMLQNTHTDTFAVRVEWADDARGHIAVENYTVQCQDAGSDTCDTGPLLTPTNAPVNANWSKSPTYRIADDQDYLPHVTVTVTNGYGNKITRVFPIEGDHRPSYAAMTPSVEMPAGKFSRIDVVEVFPSPLLTDSQELSVQNFTQGIVEQLPEGVRPDIEERNGHWYLQIVGTPQADAIGGYTFYFPFEQEPIGMNLRPAPAVASVEIKAATAPGYRSVLRDTPTEFIDRQYRNKYPDYKVQVAQVLAAGETTFGTFTGTVKCKLVTGPVTVFDKPCAVNKPFPWPADLVSDTMVASTYVQSASQPVSADGEYSIDLSTKFVDPQITQVTGTDTVAKFTMTLRDLNIILPPFKAKGYDVECSRDSAAYVACFDNGTLSLPRTPGNHALAVRATASDGAATTVRYLWSVATPQKAFAVAVTNKPVKAGAKIVVSGARLLPGEKYVIRIGKKVVAKGKATARGTVSRKVTIPKSTKAGKVKVTITGVTSKRVGKDVLRVKH